MLRLFAWLFGPVFAKEMVEMSRRPRTFWLRAAYGAGLLAVTFVAWNERAYRWGRAVNPIQEMAGIAENVFLSVAVIQFVVVGLLTPVFVGGVVAGERERGSLDLLFTTDLRDREIVLGKLASRLAVALLLIVTGLPVLSLISLFGGIDPERLLLVWIATGVALLYAGSTAVYFSATSGSQVGAYIRTYWWMTVWLLLVPTVAAFAGALLLSRSTREVPLLLTLAVNPVWSFMLAVDPGSFVRGMNRLGLGLSAGQWFAASTAGPLLWSAVLLGRACAAVRLKPSTLRLRLTALWRRLCGRFGGGRPAGRLGPQARRVRTVWRIASSMLWWWLRPLPPRAAVCHGIEVDNPLWLRARQSLVYDRQGYARRVQLGALAFLVGILLLIGLDEPDAFDDTDAGLVLLPMVWSALGVLSLLFAATSLSGDRSRGLLELVLTTPMHPGTLLRGTVLAVAQHVRIAVVTLLVLAGFLTLAGGVYLPGLPLSLIAGVLTWLVVVLTGVVLALAARSPTGALVATVAFVAAVGLSPLPIVPFTSGPGDAAGSYWILVTLAALASFLIGLGDRHGRPSLPRLVLRFTAVLVGAGTLAVCWTGFENREFPVILNNPALLVALVLEDRFLERQLDGAILALPLMWCVLAGYVVWLHRWSVRHFDWLAGRSDGQDTGAEVSEPQGTPATASLGNGTP